MKRYGRMSVFFLNLLLQCMFVSQTFAQGSSPFVAYLYVNEPEWINDANGSVSAGGMRYYRFTREPNYHYSICVGGIVGDVDLYGWRVDLPTLQDFGKRSVYTGNQEECIQFNAKVAGDYYLMVHGKASWSEYAIYVIGDKVNDYPSYMERKLSCPFETATTTSAYCRRLTNKTTAHMAAPWGWVNPNNPHQTEDTPFYFDVKDGKDHANKFHNGVDLYAPAGTPLYAVYSGVLKKIGHSGEGLCDYIAIEHNIDGNVFTTAYDHVEPSWWLWALNELPLGSISLSQFQYIGKTCDMDLSDEEPDHLHFAIRTGDFVDSNTTIPTAWSGAMGFYNWLQYGGNFVNPNPRTNPKLYIKRSRSVASIQAFASSLEDEPDMDGMPADGDLIRGSGPEIYVYTGEGKRHVFSPELMDACRFTGLPITTISESLLSEIPTEKPIDSYDDCLVNGELFKTATAPAIYMYQNGTKRHVSSPQLVDTCNALNYNAAVRTLSDVIVNPIPVGALVDDRFDCVSLSSPSTDILWRNNGTGEMAVWQMHATTLVDWDELYPSDPQWAVVGTSDFTGDRKADILWRHSVTGALAIWEMVGIDLVASWTVSTTSDLNWEIVGLADFSRDGMTDLLWRNPNTGQLAVWYLSDTTMIGWSNLQDSNPVWNIVGVGYFTQDEDPDILWRSNSTGELALWQMSGIQLAGSLPVAPVTNLAWDIVGVGDFTVDELPDLLWRNPTTGELSVWEMDGTSYRASWPLSSSNPSWEIVGVSDLY